MGASVFLWRYATGVRNYPGYHLTADATGCGELGGGLDKLLESSSQRRFGIALSPPTLSVLAVPNNKNHKALSKPAASFNLLNDVSNLLEISETDVEIMISASTDIAKQIRIGIEDVRAGHGDYSVVGRSSTKRAEHLWFWWLPVG